MRTKTLLLAAAALAVSLVSSQAQVYSGIVGYYNLPVPAHGYVFFANQLTNGANDANIVLTNGAVSDVNAVNNTTLYVWNGTAFTLYQYFTGSDADNYFLIGPGSPSGWYDSVGNLGSATPKVGEGFFVHHFGSPVTWTNVFNP